MRSLKDYPPDVDPLEPVPFVEFDPETGAIVMEGVMQRIALDMLIEDEGRPYLRKKGTASDHYVSVKQKRLKHKAECGAEVHGSIIRKVPKGSRIFIEGEEWFATDSVVDLSHSDPGTYEVTIESVTHRTKTVTVTV